MTIAMRVHDIVWSKQTPQRASNFRVVGFTNKVPIAEVVADVKAGKIESRGERAIYAV